MKIEDSIKELDVNTIMRKVTLFMAYILEPCLSLIIFRYYLN